MVPNRLKFALGAPLLEWFNPRIAGSPHERVADRIKVEARRVLEVAAGTAYLSRLVAVRRPDCRIDAVDISAESLSLGERLAQRAGIANVDFVHASAAQMPFPSGAFDTAVTCFGLHEIPSADRALTYVELARVLRPGGQLVLTDWDIPERGARTMELLMRLTEKPHAREVVRDGIVKALGEVGFTVIEHEKAQSRRLSYQFIEAVLEGPTDTGRQPPD